MSLNFENFNENNNNIEWELLWKKVEMNDWGISRTKKWLAKKERGISFFIISLLCNDPANNEINFKLASLDNNAISFIHELRWKTW